MEKTTSRKADGTSKRTEALIAILTGKEFRIGKPCEPNSRAVLMTFELPEWVLNTGFPITLDGEQFTLIRTDLGNKKFVGTIGKAIWLEYGFEKRNIYIIPFKEASDYQVFIGDEYIDTFTNLIPSKTELESY